ncbi:hypothetical protein CBQ26_20175 [Deinococcus indicus]|uniref:Uncharacterized protein n=1 Tax=Deinococcus indicus TaxID=223556 RepID=A0A2D0A747_9DEIO|nr:hypothetical protein [Deinococcus indicus]OWL93407.1 hypothetical protein CBQ26_20175 [Deinococcus indicus]
MRYIVTRPCLQEGSLRLLKYLESTFPNAGPAVLVDEKGEEHAVQVDLDRMRVWGLGGLYHAQHLGVNDVLILTLLAPGRYQVETVVKPHAPQPPPRREVPRVPETRRVVVSSTPHVREVRLQEVRPEAPATRPPEPRPAQAPEARSSEGRAARQPEPRVTEVRAADARSAEVTPQRPAPVALTPDLPAAGTGGTAVPAGGSSAVRPVVSGRSAAPLRTLDVTFETPERTPLAAGPVASGPVLSAASLDAEPQLAELARLTGYRLEHLGGGVLRLNAELGTHGYSVLVATSEAALQTPAWKENADYCVLLTTEDGRPANTPCLTREALTALIEHAHLAPLSPVDLRGYWKAGSIDLESAASVAELVSSHLAQRGAFSFVLLTLSQQPAHSVVSVPRLAERLGSGVNYAELGSILDTLTRPPFLALTPLPGGQYLLRVGVPDLLNELAEYADGVRRRVRPAAREAVPA